MKLKIELIPSSVFNKSLFQYFKQAGELSTWSLLKKEIYSLEGYECWICKSKENPLEAHEFWSFDYNQKIQKLNAIHHLCKKCHMIKHIGFWTLTLRGRKALNNFRLSEGDLIEHFCKVNNCFTRDFEKHKKESFLEHEERSLIKWEQDFSILKNKLNGKQISEKLKELNKK